MSFDLLLHSSIILRARKPKFAVEVYSYPVKIWHTYREPNSECQYTESSKDNSMS